MFVHPFVRLEKCRKCRILLRSRVVQPSEAKGNLVNIPEPDLGNVTVKGDEAVTQTSSETMAEIPGRVLFSL